MSFTNLYRKTMSVYPVLNFTLNFINLGFWGFGLFENLVVSHFLSAFLIFVNDPISTAVFEKLNFVLDKKNCNSNKSDRYAPYCTN